MAETSADTRVRERSALATPWVTIVHNDPVNLMSYVTFVFTSYFGHPPAEAERRLCR